MKRLIIAVMLLALVPASAFALNIDNLLATIAMPLAVAAVSNVANVNQDHLATFVTALNQANVPPAQFVNVVRYVPVALVDQNGQPFIAYVQQQTSQGVTGDALVNAIVQQLQSNYGVTPQLTSIAPAVAPAYVVSTEYIPATLVTPLGTSDPLAAIALPLAVAAVANISGIPQDQLASLVTTLNQANMPVVQEVQVIRYVPVALISNNGQPFLQFVQQQVAQGVTGPALLPVITQQLQTFYPTQVTVAAPSPQRVFVERDMIPPAVVSRVEEMRGNPHGGPPGLIKKQLGLQTGAEVVHGEKPGRQFNPVPVAGAPMQPVEREEHGHGRGHDVRENVPMTSAAPPAVQPQVEEHGNERGHGRGHEAVAAPPMVAPPPVAAAPAPAGPPGQEKGKGKGHGKD